MRPHGVLLMLAALALATGCLQVKAKDGFPCSEKGNCPEPYGCYTVGAKRLCYQHPPGDGGIASASGGSGGHAGHAGASGSPGGGTSGTDAAATDTSKSKPDGSAPDGACGSASDPKNCGVCGHDCTALPGVKPSAPGVECRAGICYVPPSACTTSYGHCSSRADDGCETYLLDPQTCGSCTAKCPGTMSMCATGLSGPQCASSCPTATPDSCSSSCVNLTSDPLNCGTCGHDCTALSNVMPGATGITCRAGVCNVPAAACSPGYAHCSTRADDGCETSLKTPANCGACAKTCSAPTGLCSASGSTYACSSSCDSPAPNLCGTKCVSFSSDPTNCGACNHDCTALQNVKAGATGIECRSGVCYVPPSACASGYAHCSTQPDDGCEAAVNTSSHCGSCSLTCGGSTPICSLQTQPASCLPSCGGSTPNLCSTQCVNLMTDVKNCGVCGHSCASLANVKTTATSPAVQCVSGACVLQPAACVSGYGHCSSKPDDGCETDLTRQQTCGSCTNACVAPLGLCSTTGGTPTCSSSCASPTPNLCGSKCVDTKTDPTNCGSCGHDCTALAHLKPGAAVTCNGSGGCVVPQAACAAGYANCSSGSVDIDGCETATNTNSNCGGCGIACTQPNATATCASGTCAIASCNSGYGDCTSAAGCETALNTASHCGACTTSCGGGTPTCSGSPASCTCASPNVQTCGATMCCSAPPAGAVVSCSAANACTDVCATGYHQCDGAGAFACYSNTDLQHCSDGCFDCRQSNAVAACGSPSAMQCANACVGTTLSCPNVGTKPSCGSWDFDSGAAGNFALGSVQGWYRATNIGSDGSKGQFGVSTAVHKSGGYSLFIGNDNTTVDGLDAFSLFEIQLCPSGTPLDLSNKTITMNIYTDPTVGGTLNPAGDAELFVWVQGAAASGGGYLDPQTSDGLLQARTWTQLRLASSSLGTGVTSIEIQFRTYNDAFKGTVYYDDITIQ
jgi:hypothetical protein